VKGQQTNNRDGTSAQGFSGALVTPQLHDRLSKLCGMFGSEHLGERAEAARQADGLVRRLGLTWPDVLTRPPSEWQYMARQCCEHADKLTTKERAFVDAMQSWRRPPSDKQLEWLQDIYARLAAEVPA
jgi:hypothetical protein